MTLCCASAQSDHRLKQYHTNSGLTAVAGKELVNGGPFLEVVGLGGGGQALLSRPGEPLGARAPPRATFL